MFPPHYGGSYQRECADKSHRIQRVLGVWICMVVGVMGLIGCEDKGSVASDETVIYHRLRESIQTLDPAEVGDVVTHAVAGDLFECLYDYDYTARPYRMVPLLAADMPQISEDGTVYHIPRRQGVIIMTTPVFRQQRARTNCDDFVFA